MLRSVQATGEIELFLGQLLHHFIGKVKPDCHGVEVAGRQIEEVFTYNLLGELHLPPETDDGRGDFNLTHIAPGVRGGLLSSRLQHPQIRHFLRLRIVGHVGRHNVGTAPGQVKFGHQARFTIMKIDGPRVYL